MCRVGYMKMNAFSLCQQSVAANYDAGSVNYSYDQGTPQIISASRLYICKKTGSLFHAKFLLPCKKMMAVT